jgi:lamin tail-like protein
MEPHVCRISQTGTDGRGEWVSVVNGGQMPVPLTGLELTDYTRTQQHVHIYRFPRAASGGALMLNSRETAFIFTGHGTNERHVYSNGKTELWLFAGRSAPVWNNDGDVAYLRKLDGTFVSSLTVGDPPRHPYGH